MKVQSLQMVKLSMSITSIAELETLAYYGLNIPVHQVAKHITNNTHDIQSATYALLREWRNSQINSRIAFQNLCQALQRSDMAYLQCILQQTSVSGERQYSGSRLPSKVIKRSGMLKIRIIIVAIICYSSTDVEILCEKKNQIHPLQFYKSTVTEV